MITYGPKSTRFSVGETAPLTDSNSKIPKKLSPPVNIPLLNSQLKAKQCCIQMYFGTIWTIWVPKKCAQKVLVTFLLYRYHVRTIWNIVYEYLKIFSRDTNILPQMHWTSNIFRHSATTIGGFSVLLTYPILNFKKTVCP